MLIAQSLKDRLARLEALNEGCQHVKTIQRRRKVAFDKCQRKQTLLPGKWVMVQDARKLEFLAKFDALWIGPYVIKEH
jgi:hypothetical protein